MSDWDKLMEPAREALEALIAEGDAMADRIEALVIENTMLRQTHARAERLEAALRFYADDETYETQYGRRSCGCCTDIFEPINDDRGAKARAALKGTEHDG